MKAKHICTVLLTVFYLGIHNGHIALFKEEFSAPLKVYPYSASLYTQVDLEALKRGIPLYLPSDVTSRLDDYLS